MAKKGKEFDLGGFRVQIDPFILAKRVVMRQKLLLAAVGFIGGLITISMYKNAPKRFRSDATIAIRVDALDENYVRTLMNSAMANLNADAEMMLMVNELDLYPGQRMGQPYEMALRRLRGELGINRSTGSINISFMSVSPVESQRIVAFATERVLEKIRNLLDSPVVREMQALDQAIQELEPRAKAAQTQLFEFKAEHPEIAITTIEFIPQDSPLASIDRDLKRAEVNLKRCYAGQTIVETPKALPAICLESNAAKKRVEQLLEEFTPNHPQVIAAKQEQANLQRKCDTAKGESSGGGGGPKAGMSQTECIAAANAEIRKLHEDKAEIQKKAIKKPTLQRKWAELSVEASQLQSQLSALQDQRSKGEDKRKVIAGQFQENFTLVDPAMVPEVPSEPEIGKFATLGMAVTAIIGLILALSREALRQSFLSSEEFEEQTGLTVLAVLPDIGSE
jgi:uncharacterized protein involved in exopolysaccharide biosynthesis